MRLINKEFFVRCITSLILVGCLGGAYLHSSILYYATICTIGILIFGFEIENLFPISRIKLALLSLFYPGISLASLVVLDYNYRSINIIIPLYPFLISWIADTMGYIVGKLIGKHKMCPSISPGKSWEGFVGSIFGVFGMHILLMPIIEKTSHSIYQNHLKLIILSIAMTAIAFLGGLMLSFFKRKRGLKDAGKVLPGHGGLLDRFDSVFFVSPVTLILLLLKLI